MSVHQSCSESLKASMNAVGIQSVRGLAQQSGVSRRQIERLRQGEVQRLSVENAMRLATTLNLTLMDFLGVFDPSAPDASRLAPDEPCLVQPQVAQSMALMADYQRLEQELEQQRSHLQAIFQSEALNILESLLLQWPTAAHAAQQNPTLPAVRLIPLLKPLEQLLQAWEIEAIATVGAIVPYDPTLHQWAGETAPPEVQHPVQVSHVGYRQRERLLYRAKVRLPKPNTISSH
jgi:molecular chaperone GrpE (heat shock protein)/DNA-binding Xre family transcriptional regulator